MLQAGFVRINPDSPKKTPYMIANHMIAAGVTGRCTDNPKQIPDIRKYEAQDLVAATFLSLCADAAAKGEEIDPANAAQHACQRWFGAANGDGAPLPACEHDRLAICALAQMDLCFNPPTISSKFTYEQATERCKSQGGTELSPCFGCDC